jgi:hypothetical protein
MLPGNHDAVRPAEPQPTFEKDIQQDYNTTTFVGNPCDFLFMACGCFLTMENQLTILSLDCER